MTKLGFLVSLLVLYLANVNGRSFTVDYENDCFSKDGECFRYVSGTMHYFRVLPEYWHDRLTKMKAAGLNAVQTYVEWNSHEAEPGEFTFDGITDLVKYIKTAQEVGLLVILRIGPYIDAERDMGGLPYWLRRLKPHMKLRRMDDSYLYYVTRWYSVLLPKIVPLLYSNGGPIVMVQVENEYGSYEACDFEYTSYLRDFVRKYVGDSVVLFTTDGAGDYFLKCGKIDGVYATVDFGSDSNPEVAFAAQRVHQMRGPLVNSEYYSGWIDHWGEPHSIVATTQVVNTLDKMLSMNASVNIYVFEGGTSFSFKSGANYGSKLQPNPTSYDFNAPLSEAGDPTDKYYAIRDLISKYLPLPPIPVPMPSPKLKFGPISLKKVISMFDAVHQWNNSVQSEYPLTFEQLGVPHGFILYTTSINVKPSDPAVLSIPTLNDRALVFVDYEYQGTISRMEQINSIPMNAKKGSRLDILVENQGRICYGSLMDEFKGIVSNVTLGPKTLLNWNHSAIFDKLLTSFNEINETKFKQISERGNARIPTLYKGTFTLPAGKLHDTFLNVNNWRKGIAIVNGNNLGRYWPAIGPQETLYVPAIFLKANPEPNTLLLFELEESPCFSGRGELCVAHFVNEPSLNATAPYA